MIYFVGEITKHKKNYSIIKMKSGDFEREIKIICPILQEQKWAIGSLIMVMGKYDLKKNKMKSQCTTLLAINKENENANTLV